MNSRVRRSLLMAAFTITIAAVAFGQVRGPNSPQTQSKSKKGMASKRPGSAINGGPLSKDQDALMNSAVDSIRRPAMKHTNQFAIGVSPTITVEVDFTQTLDPNTEALYQQMATILNGSSFAPNDRLNYYSYYINSSAYTVNGWYGFVSNVTFANGSYFVTLIVTPDLDPTSPYTLVSSDYTEYYIINNNNNVQYNGFSNPSNDAGQPPMTVEAG